MSTADPDLIATVEALLSDLCRPEDVRQCERDAALPKRLAEQFVAAQLHQVGVAEISGGVGGSTADAAGILRAAGRHACPLPVAEQALTAGWLLSVAGLAAPEGLLSTTAQSDLVIDGAGRASGQLLRVPWAAEVDHLVALARAGDRDVVLLVPTRQAQIAAGHNLAGERRDTVTVPGVQAVSASVPDDVRARLEARGAITRAILMAGATESICSAVIRYAQEREQFGRPINAFQAVATHLARIAEESVVATAAADLAIVSLDSGAEAEGAEVAKVAAGEAATTAARLAHQVHGAMGVTAECDLQLHTRRIWAWRDEYGGESRWARRLGARAVTAGPAGVWDVVANGAGT
jgi:acyl-CoA dehydrogenase